MGIVGRSADNAVRICAVMVAAGSPLCIPTAACGAQEQADPDRIEQQDSAAAPGNTLVPIPVLFYQPETKLGFGVAATYYFRTSGSDPTARPSTLTPVLVYTTNKQVIALFAGDVYASRERYRFELEAGYTLFPTSFWGIGNDTPDDAEEDYTPRTISLALQAQRQVFSGWYVGLSVLTGYRALVEADSNGLIESGSVPGVEDGWVIGAGLMVSWDTRSSSVYPRSGGYNRFVATLHNGVFGSDYNFASFTLDLRKYIPVLSSHVLALRGLGMASAGIPPFDLTPQLGGDALLRGFFGGRYRDRQLLAFQAEYRLPVWWRIGAVGFVGAGQVADAFGDVRFGRFHTNAGLGLRFLLSETEGLNIRADWGWGLDRSSSGFYLGLGEAF
ncbi:MAG: BamA/TamA family outer membrane protein [Gemmatimonadota bacterium]|nr:MAG: BamA/TamA family outer membrane protein [Gemmatimonadota bacterium]